MKWGSQPVYGLVLAVGVVLVACDDGAVESSVGPPGPRLSASLTEDAPGAVTFTGRVVVENPGAGEYLALTVSAGGAISILGSPSAASFCARASRELAFGIASAPVSPVLTIALLKLNAGAASYLAGTTSGDAALVAPDAAYDAAVPSADSGALGSPASGASDGSATTGTTPLLGPNSVCGDSSTFTIEETLVVSVPSAPSTSLLDAMGDITPVVPVDANANDTSMAGVPENATATDASSELGPGIEAGSADVLNE